MSVCNRVQVTKNDQHFIRLMSTMEERKASTQTNILKFIALCDILQTFKSRHQITILVIQAFRAVWFVPFVLVVLLYPVVRLANTLNQLFGDTMVIGMPPRPAPLLTKMPIKKNHSRKQSESFPERGEKCCVSEQGKVLQVDSAHSRAVFLLAGHNIAPGGRDAGWKIARQCLEKHSGKKNALADVWFVRTDVLFARARFMAVFYAHIRSLHTFTHLRCIN